eukprot:scaffold80388_cov20-Tisochrysis_lutea.AAC.1
MLARQASLAVCRGHTWDTATSKGASLVQKDLTLGLTLTHRQTHAGRRLQSARELFAWMATKGPIEVLSPAPERLAAALQVGWRPASG